MCVSYDSPNKQRVHPSETYWAVCIRPYPFNHWQRLGMGLQQKALCNAFLLSARTTCPLKPAVYMTDWFSGQSSPSLSPLSLSMSLTQIKWNVIIKHLFARSWDRLKRFRRKALRGNELNADVYLSLTRRVYQYAIQIYNWTVCTMVS